MELKDFIEMFAETIEVENVNTLTDTTIFRDLEEWSSLSAMILIATCNEKFKKKINGNDLKKCNTIQDIYNLIS